MSALWRRAVRATPLERDRVFAALLFVVAELEVAIAGGDAPTPLLMLSPRATRCPSPGGACIR